MKIVILGGGISGLTAAWYLQKNPGIKITLIEKTERLGGCIQTIFHKGFLFEQGPRSCRTSGSGIATLKLIQELGLEDQIVFPQEEAKQRFCFIKGKLRKVPLGLCALLWHQIPKFLKEPLNCKNRSEDETIYDFISRRFSSKIATHLFDPLVSGIFAGDIRQLSMKACFPYLYDLEKKHGSIMLGMIAEGFKNRIRKKTHLNIPGIKNAGLFTLNGGMELLTKTLGQHIKGEILFGTQVTDIDFENEAIKLKLENQRILEADRVYATMPIDQLGQLLLTFQHKDKRFEKISKDLKLIHYAPLIVVNCAFAPGTLKHQGFGYLIPSHENEKILGVVWDSKVFPDLQTQSGDVLTIMLGGSHHPELLYLSDDEIINITLEALFRHLGINNSPLCLLIKRLTRAIPQYQLGHTKLINNILREIGEISPKFRLLGNAFNGVSVNDCIAHAAHLASAST